MASATKLAETMSTPNVMADVKDWLLNKCRDAGSLLTTDTPLPHSRCQLTYSNVIVTPNNIPKFTIPSFMNTGLRGSVSSCRLDTELQSQSSSSGSVYSGLCGSSGSFEHMPYRQRAMSQRLMPTTTTVSCSAPGSPMKNPLTKTTTLQSLTKSTTCFDKRSSERGLLGSTNSDHMSLAALSIPHLKLQTLYGFETLTESPHTRRKESLFHGNSSEDGVFQGSPLIIRSSKRKMPSSMETLGSQVITEDLDRGSSGGRRHKRQNNVHSVIAPLGIILSPNPQVSSSQTSCCRRHGLGHIGALGSSPMSRSCSASHLCSHSVINTNSSLTTLPRHRTLSLEHKQHQHNKNLRSALFKLLRRSSMISSEDSSDLPARRKSGSHLLPSPERDQDNWDMLIAPSSMCSSSGSSPCSLCHSISPCSEKGVCTGQHVELGQVTLSLLYLPEQRQLKVGLIQAENLTSSDARTYNSGLSTKQSPIVSSSVDKKAEQLNPYVKLCLMPGKVQQQVSKVVRHTQNPAFGQDFIFNDVQQHKMAEMSLRLKVYHRTAKLARDKLLGELQVSLAELIPSQEIRLLRELEPVTSRHELGHIHISVRFNPSAEKLTIDVHQVTKLSRHTFTGTPDPYVRVELSQPRRSTTSRQTKTKKKNTSPVFNENFTFAISPKIEDLQHTSLTVTVLDHFTLCRDRQIGQVRLGLGATEEAEFHHWNQVLQQPDHVATNWHLLMDPELGHIHVSMFFNPSAEKLTIGVHQVVGPDLSRHTFIGAPGKEQSQLT